MKNTAILIILLIAIITLNASSFEVEILGSKYDIEYIERDNIIYISTDELAKHSSKHYYAKEKIKEGHTFLGKNIVFTPFSPFVSIDSESYSLGVPSIVEESSLYIPAYGFFRALSISSESTHIAKENGNILFQYEVEKEEIYNDFKSTPVLPPDEKTSQKETTNKPKEPKDKWIVVIDPGHGGKDPGAIGKSGLKEKDVVLAISKEIEKQAKDKYKNIEIYLTRDEDKFIKLSKRGKIARSKNADIFISIHCNAFKNSKPNGVETFYLSPAKTSDARATASLENASIKYEDPKEDDTLSIADFIMADFVQNEYIRESSRLANFISDNISRDISTSNRGTSSAGFYVLKDVVMPSALVEVAFISNSSDEKLLANKEFRKKIAKSVLDGIDYFTREFYIPQDDAN